MLNEETLKALTKIRNAVESANPEQLELRERMIKLYHGYLHPNHGYLISLKYDLSHLYGRAAEYTFDEMPDLLLERKIELSRHLLRVADIVEPGLTRLRGTYIYTIYFDNEKNKTTLLFKFVKVKRGFFRSAQD